MPDPQDPIRAAVENLLRLQRVGNSLSRDARQRLYDLFDDMVAELARIDPGGAVRTDTQMRRLERLVARIEDLTDEAYDALFRQMREDLARVGWDQAQWAQSQLQTILQSGGAGVVAVEIERGRVGINAMKAILDANPFGGQRPDFLSGWVDSAGQQTVKRVRREIQRGMLEGITLDDMVRNVRGRQMPNGGFAGGVLEASTRDTEAIIRTGVNFIANEGHLGTYRENANIVAGLQFTATLDARTTQICARWDGTVWPLESDDIQKPPLHYQALASGTRITTESGPVPVECVRVGDRVLTHTGSWRPVYAVMGRPVGDEAVYRLETSTGRVVTITHEHPVLTERGWQRAGDLEAGDKIFEREGDLAGGEGGVGGTLVPQTALIDAHHGPSPLDEPPVPFEIGSVAAGVSASVELQRHLAKREREVDDKGADGVLENEIHPAVGQEVAHHHLVPRRVPAVSVRNRPGTLALGGGVVNRIGGAAHALPMLFGEALRRFGILPSPMFVAGGGVPRGHVEGRAGGLAPNVDPMLLAPVVEPGLPQVELALDGADGFFVPPVLIIDELADGGGVGQVDHGGWLQSTVNTIDRIEYSGWVWNISTAEDETYIAGGVVVHNCRSVLTSILDWDRLGIDEPDDGVRPARTYRALPSTVESLDDVPASFRPLYTETADGWRIKKTGRLTLDGQTVQVMSTEGKRALVRTGAQRVSTATTYQNWFRDQAAAVQDEILGPARAKLFREGKITFRDLVTKDNRVVPLSKLRGEG